MLLYTEMVYRWHSGMLRWRSFTTGNSGYSGLDVLCDVNYISGGCSDEENQSKDNYVMLLFSYCVLPHTHACIYY